jgi:hypothetical protein
MKLDVRMTSYGTHAFMLFTCLTGMCTYAACNIQYTHMCCLCIDPVVMAGVVDLSAERVSVQIVRSEDRQDACSLIVVPVRDRHTTGYRLVAVSIAVLYYHLVADEQLRSEHHVRCSWTYSDRRTGQRL